jgi:predicted porin
MGWSLDAWKPGRLAVLTALLLLPGAHSAQAQSRQLVSLQASGAMVFPEDDYPGLESGTRLGWEAQLRFTFGRFSIGGGYQRSRVFQSAEDVGDITATLSLGFIEPRYVLGVLGNVGAPYLAARLGYGGLLIRAPDDVVRSTTESVTYGGGAGMLFRVASGVSADLGAQYFRADFDQGSSGYFMLRLGASVGLF